MSVASCKRGMWQVRGIVRLKGCSRDADSIGQLVWARFPGGVWWPGELLDPFQLPLGRTLPHGAAAGAVLKHFVFWACQL